MDHYAQLLSIPYWGYYTNFEHSSINEINYKSLQYYSKIISMLYPNTTFELFDTSHICHYEDFDISKNITLDMLYTTPMARIDNEWAIILGINEIY